MKNQFEIPILFLIFNRLDTTKTVFREIRKQKPKYLFIAADGPRNEKIGESIICDNTRNYCIKNIDWPCEVRTLFRDRNLGCRKAVSQAITWFFKNVEMGLIIEDDCLPNNSFFIFCEKMLNKYKNNKKIGMITGSNFLFSTKDYKYNYFFSKYPNIWGWATWKNRWKFYCDEINYKKLDEYLENNFKDNISQNYYKRIMYDYNTPNTSSWGIRWIYSLIKNKLWSITPTKNLIKNIGNTGTHFNNSQNKALNMQTRELDFHNRDNTIDKNLNIKLDKQSLNNILHIIEGASKIKIIILKIFPKNIIGPIKKIKKKLFR